MKKLFLTMGILACVLAFGTKEGYAQTVNFDTAINNVGAEFSHGLKKGSKVAILAIRSNSVRMSKYIIEELVASFVKQQLVTVVDNVQLDPVRTEMNYQISGEGSTSSAQSIGKKVGAQYVITGSFEPVGNYYRFRAQVLDVDTAVIILNYSVNVQNDQAVASLMGTGGKQNNDQDNDQDNYDDFNAGQRWGTWALNAFVLPGLGSYVIMKDKAGGTFQLIFGLTASVLYSVGYICILDSSYTEQVYHGPTYDYPSSNSSGYYTTEYRTDGGKLVAGYVCISIGGILGTTNFIYNIIRSSVYHKQSETALLFDPSALSIALLPARDGSIDKVHVSYTLHF